MSTTIIDFTAGNHGLIAKGKRTTIWLGDKSYSLSECKFTVEGKASPYEPIITEVRKTKFNRLTHQDALEDGFTSLNALREELQECYGQFISDFDIVTIARFEV